MSVKYNTVGDFDLAQPPLIFLPEMSDLCIHNEVSSECVRAVSTEKYTPIIRLRGY